VKDFIYDMWDKWCRYRYVDPVFSFAKICLATGAGLAAGGFGWAVTLLVPELNIPVTLEFGPKQPIFLGTILIFVGLGLGFWRIRAGNNKVGCFLIDHRGMEGMELGDPQKGLPGSCKTGQVRVIKIDYAENKNEVLRKISSINDRVEQDLSDGANGKAELVYAGLAPVPFLFYAGKVISSRKKCKIIMDWDRNEGTWHEPDRPRRSLSFLAEGPKGRVTEELVIAMPLSVSFSETPVIKSVGEVPILWLKLPTGASQDSLSSKHDQQALAEEFYNTLSGLREANPDLKRVHLFIAAQASFVFRLGQQYSTGVHPPLFVYSFNGTENRYDWRLQIGREASIENLD